MFWYKLYCTVIHMAVIFSCKTKFIHVAQCFCWFVTQTWIYLWELWTPWNCTGPFCLSITDIMEKCRKAIIINYLHYKTADHCSKNLKKVHTREYKITFRYASWGSWHCYTCSLESNIRCRHFFLYTLF